MRQSTRAAPLTKIELLIALRDRATQLIHVREQILDRLMHNLVNALRLIVRRDEVVTCRCVGAAEVTIRILVVNARHLVVRFVLLDHAKRVADGVEPAARACYGAHVAIAQRLEAGLFSRHM